MFQLLERNVLNIHEKRRHRVRPNIKSVLKALQRPWRQYDGKTASALIDCECIIISFTKRTRRRFHSVIS